jgi:hypothetical protein
MGQFSGNTIFYSPIAFGSSGLGSAIQMLTMFHEMIHVWGWGPSGNPLGDAQIAAAFGIDPSTSAALSSSAITFKLLQECGNF